MIPRPSRICGFANPAEPQGRCGSTKSRLLTLSRCPRSAARATLSAVRDVCRCRDRYQSYPGHRHGFGTSTPSGSQVAVTRFRWSPRMCGRFAAVQDVHRRAARSPSRTTCGPKTVPKQAPNPIQGRCGWRPRRRLGSRFVPAKGSTDRAGEVRRLGPEPCGRAVAGGSAAATRAVPARPGKSRCG
jgi:hypothetical protein